MKSLRFFIILILSFLFISRIYANNKVFNLTAFGDSLTAGYQLLQDDAFPKVLEQNLIKQDYNIVVKNRGVSGDTTQGGLARLHMIIREKPDAVILELGANDVLRGISPDIIYNNLDEIIAKLLANDIKVLLAGIYAPPNMGEDYAKEVKLVYEDLALKHNLLFYPFFLEGVMTKSLCGANPDLVLADGLHPNAQGVKVIAKNIENLVKDLINNFYKDLGQ